MSDSTARYGPMLPGEPSKMDRPSHAPKQSAAENGSTQPSYPPTSQGPPEAPALSTGDGVPSPGEEGDWVQEVDVWWGSYAGRTMLPSFVACALFTLATLAGALYLGIRYELNPLALRYSAYAVAGAVWVAQLGRWGYHVLTFSYRLTTRRLLLERSFFNSARAALDLPRLARVEVDRQPLERLVGVGTLRVFEEGGGVPTLELRGLLHAERVAGLIRDQAKRAVETNRPR
jgi:membrane protein YdbS with pleckstrin-like domain